MPLPAIIGADEAVAAAAAPLGGAGLSSSSSSSLVAAERRGRGKRWYDLRRRVWRLEIARDAREREAKSCCTDGGQ